MRNCLITLFTAVTLISGCAIKQDVDPASLGGLDTLCIVENQSVRASFIEALTKILDERKIQHEVMNAEEAADCEWKMTYTARWSWDLALYMAYTQINIYKAGSLDGQAVYDATQGAANMDKFIDAESKIRELVEDLFPRE